MLKLTILDGAAELHAPPLGEGPGVYVWRDLAGRPCAYGHSRNGHHWMQWPNLASYRFDDEGTEVIAYPAASAHADAILGTFHRMVLPLALQRRGLEALHASGVVIAGRVVAFCAVSGTGKSTLAYAVSRRNGCTQWSDDVVVFEFGREGVSAVAIPFDVRLLPETADGLAPLHAVRPNGVEVRAGDRAPLGAICILIRRQSTSADFEPSIKRCEGPRALASVLEHAHCFSLTDQPRKKRMLEHYLDLVERVPVYQILFSPGLHRIGALVDAVSRTFDV